MIFIYGTRVKKDNISRCFLHFFQVLIFRVNSGPKWQKTLSIAPYILRTIHHMIFIYGTYVKMLIISWCFLQFLQVLIFGVNRGGKRAKDVPKWQNYLSHSISQKAYIIWLSLLHMCEKMTSPDATFIFSKFWFFRLLGGGGKRGKNGPKGLKILSVSLLISGTVRHIIVVFGTHM